MSKTLPKTIIGQDRSSFALINPSTELYHRKLDFSGLLRNSCRPHVAISYVWSEWKHNPSDNLPEWSLIRKRLLGILGPKASAAIRLETGNASCCWLDSKCVDQDSISSKSYWIPRMDEIYAKAKCTVLLLNGSSFSVLIPVVESMKCKVKSKARIVDWPHSCLLSQSCTVLPSLSTDEESACIQALRRLYDGNWRKRAWIFQEILLSKNYILSFEAGSTAELCDIGVLANLLLQRHPNESWLGSFSDWSRRLFYLRRFYAESKYHHLSDANILQMARGLESSVAADKIYALCGILRLKDVPYNSKHSAEEAFQVVVGELVKRGRMAWLYAVPAQLNGEGIPLNEANMTPFVLTRLSNTLARNRNKMHVSNTSIRMPVLHLGKITRTKLLADVLQKASDWNKEHKSFDFPPELEFLFFLPKIVRRVALDMVNPLLIEPLFSQISDGLGITPESGSRPTRVWRMIMALCTRDITSPSRNMGTEANPEETLGLTLADSAARSLQDRLRTVQNEFLVLWWCSNDDNSRTTLGLGPRTCRPGNQICSVKDSKDFLLAVSFLTTEPQIIPRAIDAHFNGMVYSLDTVMTIEWRVKILGLSFIFSPLDLQGPVLGDHPHNDKFKDCQFDEYIKTDTVRDDIVLMLFGKSWKQKGELVELNLVRKA